MEKFQSWDANLASHTPDVQAAARALDALIREELPDVVVQYDQGNGLLAWEFGKHRGSLGQGDAFDDRVAADAIARLRAGSAGPLIYDDAPSGPLRWRARGPPAWRSHPNSTGWVTR